MLSLQLDFEPPTCEKIGTRQRGKGDTDVTYTVSTCYGEVVGK